MSNHRPPTTYQPMHARPDRPIERDLENDLWDILDGGVGELLPHIYEVLPFYEADDDVPEGSHGVRVTLRACDGGPGPVFRMSIEAADRVVSR